MESKEILAANELIGRFLGMESPLPKNVDKFKYHSDWNWLMPVVEKIEREYSHGVIMYPEYTYLIGDGSVEDIENVEYRGKNRIESTYMAVVAFITAFNKWNK